MGERLSGGAEGGLQRNDSAQAGRGARKCEAGQLREQEGDEVDVRWRGCARPYSSFKLFSEKNHGSC